MLIGLHDFLFFFYFHCTPIRPTTITPKRHTNPTDMYFPGLNAQSAETAAAAAAGLLPQMNMQNLAALAAMTQPSLQAVSQPAAQLTNAAALLCKFTLN